MARAEADREADRLIEEVYRAADRFIAGADRARAESDRAVARERLLLRNRQAELNNQPYPVGTPMGKLNLSEHGEDDAPPWRNGRPDRVATEWGAHMRGEKKLTYKKAGQFGRGGFVTDQDTGEAFHIKLAANGLNTQDQSSEDEYYTTGGALVHPDLKEPFQFKPLAPSPPETALPKGDYRYNREETTNEPFQFKPPAQSPPEAAVDIVDGKS